MLSIASITHYILCFLLFMELLVVYLILLECKLHGICLSHSKMHVCYLDSLHVLGTQYICMN